MQELCRKKGVNERKKLISVGHLNKMYCPCRVNQVPDTIYRISCKAVFSCFSVCFLSEWSNIQNEKNTFIIF